MNIEEIRVGQHVLVPRWRSRFRKSRAVVLQVDTAGCLVVARIGSKIPCVFHPDEVTLDDKLSV